MDSKKNVKLRLRRFQYTFLLLMLFSPLNNCYIFAFSFGVTSTVFYLFQKLFKVA